MIESVDFENTTNDGPILNEKRFIYTKVPEERFNTISHFLGGVLSLIGLIPLLIRSNGDKSSILISIIYVFSNAFLFFASSLCHSQKLYEDYLSIYSTFDQIAIYIMIAGTYTPVVSFNLPNGWKIGLIIAQWSFALIGIVMKLFYSKTPRWFTALIYIIQGWMLIPAVGQLTTYLSVFHVIMVFVGGLFYTIGAIFYITKKPKLFPGVFGAHELWHIFVMLGALSFYIVVLQTI